ncbi:hypothetical protein BH23ACT2_BH23ACT2_26580 [soil metagenome]
MANEFTIHTDDGRRCRRSRGFRSGVLAAAGLTLLGACGASGNDDSARATTATSAAISSTTAPPDTTSAPPETTSAPVVTTTAPPTTTAAPATTTPPTTTAPPTTTTTAPPTTTTAPALPQPTTAPPLPDPVESAVAACGPPEGTWFVTTYTTANHVVHICDSFETGEVWYRGRNIESGDSIDLPADFGDFGVFAVNGSTEYYVNGEVLEVYQGDELILEEAVLSVE